MGPAQAALDEAADNCRSLNAALARRSSRLVRSKTERAQIRATVRKWFEHFRPAIAAYVGTDSLLTVDSHFQWLINAAAHETPRSALRSRLRALPRDLAAIESDFAVELAAPGREASAPDPAPNFAPLAANAEMQLILSNRWREIEICVNHGAPLAATIMIGGMLESLFLARINGEDKAGRDRTFKCQSAPKDKATGTPRPLNDWKLVDYIAVAHERQWITPTLKDLSGVLRDYRNLVHPQKELSQARVLNSQDAAILWAIARQMISQILIPR